MPSQNSFSIYRSVEDDEAELHIEDTPEVKKKPHMRNSKLWDLPLWQKIAIAVIITGCFAFIFGYLITRRPCAACTTNSAEEISSDEQEPNTMDWFDLKDLFSTVLKEGQQIESTIRRVSRAPHPAGSSENDKLAEEILQQFRSYTLDHTWVESHYAKLQYPNRNRPNTLKIVNDNQTIQNFSFKDQDTYCPYSAVGSVKAGLVYANYGRKKDFMELSTWDVNVTNNLVIVRAGLITFAEKVYNAERAGAVGVLIFPDLSDIAVYGHVHFGTGDPDTPGFPSFNHTQFPPFKSSGLPKIPAQPIDKATAQSLLSKLAGKEGPSDWRSPTFPSHSVGPNLKTRDHMVQLEVTNVEKSVALVNVFGSITGRFEPEHYIVVGAQRDSWGPGAAKSGVGTAILLELLRSMTMMVSNGFQPRRSILFVSWDGGDFGSIGATEWLEGYLSMLHLKAATYMSLDTPLLGDEKFVVKSSPLLRTLIEGIIKQVDNPRQSMLSIYDNAKVYGDLKNGLFAPLAMDTGSFAFTAFAGVPAVEFSFVERTNPYKYLDTKMDTYDNLNSIMDGRLPAVAGTMAETAGLTLIKLSHDRILPLDYTAYNTVLLEHLVNLNKNTDKLEPQGLTFSWLYSARGDYARATERLKMAIKHSDLYNEKIIQFFNVRIMRVEFYFLSQYVSAINYPYRHILIGRGEHTLDALMEQLGRDQIDTSELHKQIALFTWTLVGAANALSGEVWEIQRNF